MLPVVSRIVTIVVVAALALLAAPPPHPAQAFEIKLCDYCRRIWDDSPCRIRGSADANGKQKTIFACSPFCLAAVLKHKPHYELSSTQIVPWAEREEISPPMLSTTSAKFLIGVSDKRDRSHDPDIAAFRNDKLRGEGREMLGGEAITWEKLMERCKKLAAETDDEPESDYRPRKHRQY